MAIIGAGLGGLATAIRLAKRGYGVHLFEQHERAGGKASTLRLGGYRFDTGPSLFTMRDVFDELFEDAGTTLEDQITLRPLDPICSYYYPDGSLLRAWSNQEQFAKEIEERTLDSAETLRSYLAYCRRIYDSAGELFLRNSLHEPATYLQAKVIRELLRPWRSDPLRTVHQANDACFRDPKLVQLFDRYATYNGSDPFRAPATLNIIPYVEHCLGAFGVEGGIYSIVQSLERLAAGLGVHFHYSSPVERITLSRGRVRSITTGGRELKFDIVVSNADVAQMHRLLSNGSPAPRGASSKAQASSSAILFLWGMTKTFPELDLHSVFFCDDYRSEFGDIFDRGVTPRDPTVYLHISSKVSPADAPPGGENWFLLVNAPPNQGQDWAREVERLRPRVMERVGRALGSNLPDLIAVERVLTPVDIEALTGSERGSLYGVASNSRMSAFRRHPNRVPGISGLYACGGSAHPGGGMPLVLLSAKITVDLIQRYER